MIDWFSAKDGALFPICLRFGKRKRGVGGNDYAYNQEADLCQVPGLITTLLFLPSKLFAIF